MADLPTFQAGDTGLIVPFPDLDAVIGRLRRRHDPAAAYDIPAHVTVLYPFVARERLDPRIQQALADIASYHRPFEVSFGGTGRFRRVLYLVPRPSEPFADLTEAVWARWPAYPPYEGAFDEVIPHLTIGHGDEMALDRIAAEARERLPVTARAESLDLLMFDGQRWTTHRSFSLGGSMQGRSPSRG